MVWEVSCNSGCDKGKTCAGNKISDFGYIASNSGACSSKTEFNDCIVIVFVSQSCWIIASTAKCCLIVLAFSCICQ